MSRTIAYSQHRPTTCGKPHHGPEADETTRTNRNAAKAQRRAQRDNPKYAGPRQPAPAPRRRRRVWRELMAEGRRAVRAQDAVTYARVAHALNKLAAERRAEDVS